MKRMHVVALAATFALPAAAYAAPAQQPTASGHSERRTVPQFGPHSTGPTRTRRLVPENAPTAA